MIDPSGATVASVDVVDCLSGTAAGVSNVTATFEAPVPLSEPGTYTLGIKGGDFLGANEAGNHTAIDHLSTNGEVGGEVGLQVTEIVFNPVADTLTLTWNSSPGQVCAVKYSTDLEDWDADLDDGIDADDGTTTLVEFDLSEAGLQDLAKGFLPG